MSKVLVAYFSRADENYYPEGIKAVKVGNTAKVAQKIAALTGGQLFEIKGTNSYPAKYHPCTKVAKAELERGDRPQLVADIDTADYDTVYLGFPIWWGTFPVAVFTFLEGHDLAHKTIVPFCTHEGSSFDRSLADIKRLQPQASVAKGLSLHGYEAQYEQADSKIERFVQQQH